MLTASDINDVSKMAFDLVLSGSAPSMLAAGIAGLTIAILQALTQVQDQGLPTAVKFFAVMGVLYATYHGLSASITGYGDMLFGRIAGL